MWPRATSLPRNVYSGRMNRVDDYWQGDGAFLNRYPSGSMRPRKIVFRLFHSTIVTPKPRPRNPPGRTTKVVEGRLEADLRGSDSRQGAS